MKIGYSNDKISIYINCYTETIAKNGDGKTIIINEPLDSFLVGISKPHAGVYDEASHPML
jgi:hypothetical protein